MSVLSTLAAHLLRKGVWSVSPAHLPPVIDADEGDHNRKAQQEHDVEQAGSKFRHQRGTPTLFCLLAALFGQRPSVLPDLAGE